jgi:hypothetical protein
MSSSSERSNTSSSEETKTVTEIHNSDSSSSSSSEESKKKVSNVKITKEFQENVIKYVKLDDLIKQKQEELTELKKQLKPCEQFILSSLDSLNESSIGITNGTLVKKKVETKTPLSTDIIKAGLLKKFNDANAVEELVKMIEGERALKTKTDLKRTKGKPDGEKKAKKKTTTKKQ